MIKLKRAYESATADDGTRYLVERLWPRGVTKQALRLHAWLKDVAPSDGLRRWFSHDPAKWQEFRRRYTAELSANAEAWKPILALRGAWKSSRVRAYTSNGPPFACPVRILAKASNCSGELRVSI